MSRIAMFYAVPGCVMGLFTFAVNSYNAIFICKKDISRAYSEDQQFASKCLDLVGSPIIHIPICICKSLSYGIFWPISTGVLIKRTYVAYQTNNIEWLSPFYIPGASTMCYVNKKYLLWPLNPERE